MIALRAKTRKSTVVASSKGLTRKNSFKCEIGVFGVKEEKPKNVTPVYSNDQTPKKDREQFSGKKKSKE